MTLAPAAVLSPSMMKLSGTVMVEVTVLGVSIPGVPVGAGIGTGVSAELYWTVVVGPFWAWPRSTARPAFWLAVEAVAERVEDRRAELDRVGAAELLEREADCELGRRVPFALSEPTTGVTEICGVMLSDQLSSMPVAVVEELEISSVQSRLPKGHLAC